MEHKKKMKMKHIQRYKKHISVIQESSDLELNVCELKDCCSFKVHCPLCTPKSSPLSPDDIREHMLEAHIKDAVRTIEWLVLVCDLNCGVYKTAHYHCPYCGLLLKEKKKIEDHLVTKCVTRMKHKLVSSVKSNMENSEMQPRQNAEPEKCTELQNLKQPSCKQSIWDAQDSLKPNYEQRKRREQFLNSCPHAHMSMVFDITDLDIYRCTDCCTQFHCPLCPVEIIKSNSAKKILDHLQITHFRSGVEYSGMHVMKCRQDCLEPRRRIGQSHYHCPLCPVKMLIPKRYQPHLECHARGTNKVHRRHLSMSNEIVLNTSDSNDVDSIENRLVEPSDKPNTGVQVLEGQDEHGNCVEIQFQMPIASNEGLNSFRIASVAQDLLNSNIQLVSSHGIPLALDTIPYEPYPQDQNCSEMPMGQFEVTSSESEIQGCNSEVIVNQQESVSHTLDADCDEKTKSLDIVSSHVLSQEETVNSQKSTLLDTLYSSNTNSVIKPEGGSADTSKSSEFTSFAVSETVEEAVLSEEYDHSCTSQNFHHDGPSFDEDRSEQVSITMPWQKYRNLSVDFDEFKNTIRNTFPVQIEYVKMGDMIQIKGSWENISQVRNFLSLVLKAENNSIKDINEGINKYFLCNNALMQDHPKESQVNSVLKNGEPRYGASNLKSSEFDSIQKRKLCPITDLESEPEHKRSKNDISHNTHYENTDRKIVISKPGKMVALLMDSYEEIDNCHSDETYSEIIVKSEFNPPEQQHSKVLNTNSQGNGKQFSSANEIGISQIATVIATKPDTSVLNQSNCIQDVYHCVEGQNTDDNVNSYPLELVISGTEDRLGNASGIDTVGAISIRENQQRNKAWSNGENCPICNHGLYSERKDLLMHILTSPQCFNDCYTKSKTHLNKELSLQLDRMKKCRSTTCFLCKRTFQHINQAKIHYALSVCCPKQKKNQHNIPKNANGMYYCEFCDYEAKIPFKVWQHMERKHLQKDIKCDECAATFTTAKFLQIHKERVHMDQKKTPCEHCGKIVFNKYMRRHYNDVHNPNYVRSSRMRHEAEFKCGLCRYTTNITADLKRHQKRIHGRKNKKCAYCPAAFAYPGDLNIHIKTIHTERKIVSCDLCGKKLYEKHLASHIRNIHENHKDFVCRICGKALQSMFSLKYHVETHKKPADRLYKFKCNECGSGFMSRSVLQDHLNTHSGLRPYTCDMCSKTFRQRSVYHKHLEIHNNVKFMCAFCGLVFSDKKQVLDHKEKIHLRECGTVSPSVPAVPCVCGHSEPSHLLLSKHQQHCAMYQAVQTFEPQHDSQVDSSAETVTKEEITGTDLISNNQQVLNEQSENNLVLEEIETISTEKAITTEEAAAILAQHGAEYHGREVIQMGDGTMLVIQNLPAGYEEEGSVGETQQLEEQENSENVELSSGKPENASNYQCAYCQQIFADMEETEKHIYEYHMDSFQEESNVNSILLNSEQNTEYQ